MAKQPTLKETIGYSSKEISSLSKEELRNLVNRAINRANRRLGKLEEGGLEFSPAFSNHPNKISKKGLKKMTKKELRSKLTESVTILKDPTSTTKGAKAHIDRINAELKKAEQESFKRKVDFGKKWGRIVSKLQELYPNYSPSEIKDIVEETATTDKNVVNMTEDEVINYINEKIQNGYHRIEGVKHKWKPRKRR